MSSERIKKVLSAKGIKDAIRAKKASKKAIQDQLVSTLFKHNIRDTARIYVDGKKKASKTELQSLLTTWSIDYEKKIKEAVVVAVIWEQVVDAML